MISVMPSASPAPLPEAPPLLIAAFSGRALAGAARASGYVPLVADFFGDADMRAMAGKSVQMKGDFATGFQLAELLAGLQALAAGQNIAGLVCGSGFEDRPGILAELARHWPLLGCSAGAVELVKHPLRLAKLCAGAGVAYPETRLAPPEDAAGWLRKQAGGSGGGHVVPATDREGGHGVYFQRQIPGTPVSLLALASGGGAKVLGSSSQWADPAAGRPFRYGGAVRPALVGAETLGAMACAVRRLVEGAGEGFAGLASFDFLIGGDTFTLLEVNPRPGATLDVFNHPDLMQAHIAACKGLLPAAPLAFRGAIAAAILYCDRSISAFPQMIWPDWTKDHPNPSSHLQSGAPVCTIVAAAAEPHAARRLLDERISLIRRLLAENQQA